MARSLGYQDLNEHQLLVVSNLVTGNDVFDVLPTGYGKSSAYVTRCYRSCLTIDKGREGLETDAIT